jgi:hypothetical protein
VGNICRAVPLLAGSFPPNRSIKFLSSLCTFSPLHSLLLLTHLLDKVDDLPRCNTRASTVFLVSVPLLVLTRIPTAADYTEHRILIHISILLGRVQPLWSL